MFGAVPMIYSRNFREVTQDTFGGMDRRVGAKDGAIADMLNMCADSYPALTVRPRRGELAVVQNPRGFLVRDCMVWVSEVSENNAWVCKLAVDGEVVGQLTAGQKLLVGIQKKICIWPDKMIYDRETGEMTGMEATWEGQAGFGDGTYAGEPALANTITAEGNLTGLFRAGDGVAVTVQSTGNETYGAFVIQEIEYDATAGRTALRFLEETWRMFVQEAAAAEGEVNPFPGVGSKHTVRIQRRAPDLDGAFEHHNRIWGWHGGTMCCCKLGDPANWESYNGDSTDSWELETGSPGSITGGISYGGRPVLFKERSILRIYGDYPAQYSLSETESLGVEAGSAGSLAVAGDVLYYKSAQGIMAYTGGYPYAVGEELGQVLYRNAVAGSDGVRYYVSMECDGEPDVFCFDTRHRTWHRENGMRFIGCGCHGDLYAMEERGTVWALGNPRQTKANEDLGVKTWVEFADFAEGTTRKKGVSRLMLRLEMDGKTQLDLYIRYNSRGDWIPLKHLDGPMDRDSFEVIIPIRRCDHYRIKIVGQTEYPGGIGWTLHSLTRERAVGSNRK